MLLGSHSAGWATGAQAIDITVDAGAHGVTKLLALSMSTEATRRLPSALRMDRRA